jgi:hypothetical protein
VLHCSNSRLCPALVDVKQKMRKKYGPQERDN